MTDQYRPDVVAGKYDPKLFDPSGGTLLVNEIFYSLQGEGRHTGRATVFIRLAKCNLACKFCDTEFETFHRMTVEEVVAKVLSLIPDHHRMHAKPLIDITGGEPLLQNCGPLVRNLQLRHFAVGCETSGSVWNEWATELDHVTCSPKVPKARIPEPLLQLFKEDGYKVDVKWIVNAAFLSQFERDADAMYIHGPRNYLQPESNLPKYIAAASKLIMAWPHLYQLSLQTHKIAGNP